jgi:hypothetical protein
MKDELQKAHDKIAALQGTQVRLLLTGPTYLAPALVKFYELHFVF